MDEVRDRYGPPPASVLNLAEYASIRLLADRIGLESIDREAQIVVLKFRPEAKLDPQWLFRVVQERGDLDPGPAGDAEAGPARPRRPRARRPRRAPAAGGQGQGQRARPIRWRPGRGGRPGPRPARSRSGFTRDEILRPAKEDPRAEGGRVQPGGGLAARVERRRVDAVKYCVSET